MATINAKVYARRGARVSLPQPLLPGELGWCLDTKQMFIGVDEDNAAVGVQLHTGQPVGSQLQVNDFLYDTAIEFDLRPEQLNRSKPSSANPLVPVDETEVLASLMDINSTDWIVDHDSTYITGLEADVKLLKELRTAIDDVMLSELIDIADYHIMYGYTTVDPAEVDSAKVYVDPTAPFLKTAQYYVFTFQIILDAGLNLSIPADRTRFENILNKLNAIQRVDNAANLGAATDNPGADSGTNRELIMASGFLYVPTVRASANYAAAINKFITPNGLVNTKQNIEIITEYINLSEASDLVLTAFNDYIIIPNTTAYNSTLPVIDQLPPDQLYPNYTAVVDNASVSPPLAFSVEDSNIIKMTYSAETEDGNFTETGEAVFVRTGTLISVTKHATEARSSYASPALAGPGIQFFAVANAQMTIIQYRHNFATPIRLKIQTKRWVS